MTLGFWHSVAVHGFLALLLAMPLKAVGDDDLDVTMRMVGDNDELTESVVREIELPEPVALERRKSGAGKPAELPLEAREKGREAARAATERAREVREQNEPRGRPELPGATERPGRPVKPERPERP